MNGLQVGAGLLLLSVTAATSLAEERARGSLDLLHEHAALDTADRGGEVARRFSGCSDAGDSAGALDFG